MNEQPARPRKKGCGCLWVLSILLLLITGPIVINQFTPYLREPRSVTVTLLDQVGQPVAGADITYYEWETVLYIPPLAFASPMRTVERRVSVRTDNQGQAHFTLQYERAHATSVSLNGTNLPVDYSLTSDTFRGPGGRSFPGQLPSWDFVGGVSKLSHESTIVVSRLPAK
ncbi:hypothetical protein ACXR0O_09130 [Verrucomicrobiota bacterium sgz303538]